jgi:hypothetical protein
MEPYELPLSLLIRELNLAPPKLVPKNKASKAKNPVLVPVPNHEANNAIGERIYAEMVQYARFVPDPQSYTRPPLRVISVATFLQHLPAIVTQLGIDGAADRLAEMDWFKTLAFSRLHAELQRVLTLKREADERVENLQAAVDRMAKRPRLS